MSPVDTTPDAKSVTVMTGFARTARPPSVMQTAGFGPEESAFVQVDVLDKGTLVRLQTGQWLNDTLVAAFLHQVLRRAVRRGQDDIHIFSSFFWTKYQLNGAQSVTRWLPTTGKPLFERRFIVLPISLEVRWLNR